MSSDGPVPPRTRLVIVDDNDDVRMLLRALAGRDPRMVVVAEASRGDEALQAVIDHRPDAVLLDVAMPETDGLWALRRIRRAVPSTRVIMHSAVPDARERALALGAHGWVDKSEPWSRIAAAIDPPVDGAVAAE